MPSWAGSTQSGAGESGWSYPNPSPSLRKLLSIFHFDISFSLVHGFNAFHAYSIGSFAACCPPTRR